MTSAAKKKGKGKKVSLNEFLGNENAPNFVKSSSNWADEMEEEDAESDQAYAGTLIDRSALPTAPRAARGANVDLDKVPTAPPFTAFLGNLPFEVCEEDIETFFKQQQVTNIRLIEDGGRAKGYGYAEFADRQSLIDALAMDETTMHGRPVRVNLAEGRQGGGDRDGRNKYDDFDDRTGDDWRRKPAGGQDSFDNPRGGGRDDDRGSRGDRYGNRSSRHQESEDEGPWRRNAGGGGGSSFDRNDRYGGNRDKDDGGRGFGSGYREERRRYSPPRDRYSSDNRRDDGYSRRDDSKRDDSKRSEDRDEHPKERPKLQLQKRSKPAEEQSKETEQRSSSIFGAAKPVDTLSKELAFEQKRHEQKRHEPAPAPAPQSRSANIFGAAKPVDTSAREREIESKMKSDRSRPSESDRRSDRGSSSRGYDDERPKPRRDSAGSPDSRPVRRIPSRPKRESETEEHAVDEEEVSGKTSPPPLSPKDETKLIPAPPPKENVWAKRKEQQAPPTPEKAIPEKAAPTKQIQPSKDHSEKSDTDSKKESKESTNATSEADDNPHGSENTAPGGPPVKPELVPSSPPAENVWAKRAQQQSVPTPTAATKVDETRAERQEIPRDVERKDTRNQGRTNAWARGASARGRGGSTAARGRGAGRGSDVPARKHREEKPLPKSIDEMPKYEEKLSKDLSDSNKFSLLLDDEGGHSEGD